MSYSNNPISINSGSGIQVSYVPGGETGICGVIIDTSVANLQYYGLFYSTVTQVNAGTTVDNAVTFNTSGPANGITIAGTNITFAHAGTYTITTNAQVAITTGGPGTFDVWFEHNDVNVPGSSNTQTLSGGGSNNVLNNSWILTIAAGDTVQVSWRCSTANGELAYLAPQTNPTRPESPSIVVSITQIA